MKHLLSEILKRVGGVPFTPHFPALYRRDVQIQLSAEGYKEGPLFCAEEIVLLCS